LKEAIVADEKLIDVVFQALKDEKFFNALTKDVSAALRDANITLSEDQTAQLKHALEHPTQIELDLSELLRAVHRHHFFKGVFGRWVGTSWVNVMHDYHDDDK
jgi:hypothetical protein